MTLREKLARAMCQTGDLSPDEIMPNDGPRWRYYLPQSDISIALVVEECAKEADLAALIAHRAHTELKDAGGTNRQSILICAGMEGTAEGIADRIRALAKPAQAPDAEQP